MRGRGIEIRDSRLGFPAPDDAMQALDIARRKKNL
jgi:hypothetical protein